MPNPYVNKVVYGSTTLIDLTQDTVDASKVLAGYTFHGADGAPDAGECLYDVDSSNATAVISEVLSGKTFAKGGQVLTGEMPNVGAQNASISAKAQEVSIQRGYHDGSGKVGIDSTEQAKIIPENIKDGVSILGVTGSYSGAGVSAQAKTVSPALTQQVVLPDTGYDYLSQVTINAIPYTEVDNAAGGKTVTIGAAS
jgi:hypothetical protein